MKIDLSGKNILLTGASRGIGESIAGFLVDAGAKVTIHYSSNREKAEKLAASLGENAVLFKADLAIPEDCTNLFNNVLNTFGHIDVLINNAGVAINSPLNGNDEQWVSDWQQTMAVNLQATGILCRLAIPHFAQRGGGRIINIASRASFRGDTPEYLAYAASKGGVVSLTRSIARGFGKQGIKAFIVAPGFIRTDMAREFVDEYGEEFVLSDIALNRMTEPKDVAPIITLLASGMADHATGCTIDINAGSYVH